MCEPKVRLQRHPDAAAPIAPSGVVVMPVAVGVPMLMEIPIVGVKIEGHAGSAKPAVGVPAIAFMVAGNIGAGADGAGGEPRKGKKCGGGAE